MKVTSKRSMIYRGKFYRPGDVIEVDEPAEARRDFFLVKPEEVDEPAEVQLPPLKKK